MKTMIRVVEARLPDEPRLYDRAMDWLVAAYVILLPVQIHGSDFVHVAVSDVVLLTIVGGVLLGRLRLRHVPSAWSFWHVAMVFTFALATVVALVRTGQVGIYALGIKDVGLLALFAGYAVMVGEAATWARVRWIARLLVLSVAIQNTVFVLGMMANWTTGFTIPGLGLEKDRLTGMLIDPNAYGGLLVLTLSLHMTTYCSRQPLVPGLAGRLTALSLVLGVILSYSRSAWIGMVLLFVAITVFQPRAAVYLIAMCGLALLLTFVGFGGDYGTQMSELTFRTSQIEERVELADLARMEFWTSPAFGIGMGVFDQKYRIIIHNTPLWILTECGIFGFIVLIGFAGWFLARGVGAFKAGNPATKALVLGLMLASLSMIGLSMGIEALYQRHWWLVLALTAACYELTRRDAGGRRLR